MFNVSLIMENGRCIVWRGEAKSPADAVELAIAQAESQTGTEALEIQWSQDVDPAR